MAFRPFETAVIPLIMSSSTVRYDYTGRERLAVIKIILQKVGNPDDTLVIRPARRSTSFDVTFTQNTIGARAEYTVTHTDLFPYLERFINTIYYDAQRCDYVQFEVPTYTSVVMKIDNAYAYMDTLYTQVRSLHNCWPYEVNGEKIVPQAPHAEQPQAQQNVFVWENPFAQRERPQPVPLFTEVKAEPVSSPRVTRAAARRAAAATH